MELIINGETLQVPDTVQTVQGMVEHFKLDQKVLIVELNKDIVEKSAHAETMVSNGDRVEIVHFVGGG